MSYAGVLNGIVVYPPMGEVHEVPNEGQEKQPEKLLKPEDVAERLNVTAFTVREWLRNGKLKGIRLAGKVWRVRPSDLEEFLAAGEKSATEEDEGEG